ncbi:MAG: DNA ligase [Colwellia sp.]|nr:DNA ligase [Colwellia sp.]
MLKFNGKIYCAPFLLFLLLFSPVEAQVKSSQKPKIQHAITYKAVEDIKEYWLSEKLDGMRGYWNGKQLITRQGNLIYSPKWFTKNWPKHAMDGELWIKRNQFQTTMSCVRKRYINEVCWRKVRFMLFDLPEHNDIFTLRIKAMQQLIKTTDTPYLAMVEQFKVTNIKQLDNKLNTIIEHQGEGLMLHLGSAYYHVGRTANIMKLKKHQDGEASVIAHLPGKGKYTGKMGAIRVKTTEGIIFKIGSGFSDKERDNPPAIGSIITYKYNGKTQADIPRFARYWRIRADK